MRNAPLIVTLLASFAMPSASATPATTATTNWSQLQFSVIDLTPDDGIAAGFTLTRTYSAIAMEFIDSAGKYVSTSDNYASIAHETVSRTIEGKAITVAGTETSSNVSVIIGSPYAPRGQATVSSTSAWEFTLAPNSLLLLTGEATLGVGMSEVMNNQLRASAEFTGMGWLEDNTLTDFSYFRTTQYGQTGDFNTGFGLSLSNVSDDSLRGSFRLTSHNFGRVFTAAIPPPVPEPATCTMLVVGLAAIAVAASRRRTGTTTQVRSSASSVWRQVAFQS